MSPWYFSNPPDVTANQRILYSTTRLASTMLPDVTSHLNYPDSSHCLLPSHGNAVGVPRYGAGSSWERYPDLSMRLPNEADILVSAADGAFGVQIIVGMRMWLRQGR